MGRVFDLSKGTRIRVRIQLSSPCRAFLLCPSAPPQGRGARKHWLGSCSCSWVAPLNWPREVVFCPRWLCSLPWSLQSEVWVAIPGLCEGALWKPPLWADVCDLCSFCLHFPISWNSLSSFLHLGSPATLQISSVLLWCPSTQLSLPHSTHCGQNGVCLPHWRCVLLAFCLSLDWAAHDQFTFESCRNLLSKRGHCSLYLVLPSLGRLF